MTLLKGYKITSKIYIDRQNNTYYRAIEQSKKKSVILKVKAFNSSNTDEREWLKREFEISQELDITGVINVDRIENIGDRSFIVLENFSGVFLQQYLKKKSFTINFFLEIAIQLSRIVRQIHQEKIIHQNLNPSSIVIDSKNHIAKITNLSIARKISDNATNDSLQSEATDIAYISPEQTGRTNNIVNYSTDFYSLGVIFYRMLTGTLPCDGQDSLKTIYCHLAQIPVAPDRIKPQIPPVISSIVMKLLAKDPERRYQSAYGIEADLETCKTQYQSCRKIKSFELGTLDRCSRFVVSKKLYGCTDAMQTAISALERVYRGGTEVVLLEGQLGTGKSTFVNEFQISQKDKKHFFLKGRFEPAQINIPYTGIIKGFNDLVRYLLTQDARQLKLWREKILSAVGNNGKLITDIFPDLKWIIGSQSDIIKLPAKETENRFNSVFIEFIKVFINKEHPLIIFLDDMQWADSASLNLLALLLNHLQNSHLLIILAYQVRNYDTDKANLNKDRAFSDLVTLRDLLLYIEEKNPQNIAVNKIKLLPFKTDNVNQLLIDTLNCDASVCLPLAKLLFKRSKGNPLLVKQLLQNLYDDELIWFDFDRAEWNWNYEEISNTLITDYDVLDLIAERIEKLSAKSQQILKIAACINSKFEVKTLAALYQESEASIVKELESAMQADIIFSVTEHPFPIYQFVHNRIRQTTYSLLSETEKADIHLKIGLFLLQNTDRSEITAKIFNLVNHFNLAISIISDRTLKNRVAELNLIAGKKAKSAIAYEVAANHLQIAINLVPSSAWKDNYDFIFEIYLEAIEIQYLLTNFQRVESLSILALNLARTTPHQIKIYEIKIHSHIGRNQMQLAIDTGVCALDLLEVSLSKDSLSSSSISLKADLNKLLKSLNALPIMNDFLPLAAMKILGVLIPPIYIIKPELFPVVVLKMIDFCLRYGNSRFSAFAYALYGLLRCGEGDIEGGYQLGKLALAMRKQFEAPELESKVNFIFNSMIRHWREPITYSISDLLEGIQHGIEVGDIEHACFHAQYYCNYLFFAGEALPSVIERSQPQIQVIQSFKQTFQLNYARIWHQLNLNLQGQTGDRLMLIGDSFDELKMLPFLKENNDATSLFALYLAKLILCYLLKNYQEAVSYVDKAREYLKAAVGTMCFSMYYFYAALAKLAFYGEKTKDKSELSAVIDYQKQLKLWANHAPDNYLNKYYLVTAEIAKTLGRNKQAAESYDRSITAAAKAGYLHEQALAEELTAEFYLSIGRKRIAGYYITDAYLNYSRWGALAKTKTLKVSYKRLLDKIKLRESALGDKIEVRLPSPNINPNNLDLFSVIKASQAISSEIFFDSLLSKMMTIVIENAGAQKTTLFLQENSSWIIAASATLDPELTINISNIPIAEHLELPNFLINYIQSSHETILLENATRDSLFKQDPYIVKYQPKSLLACPIVYKDRLQGIIILENGAVEGAFTNHKLEILKVLLTQVSISIENARLYKNLEDHLHIKNSLKQKEILLKEIHHRVKNNLLVVSSLLDFQSSYTEDPTIHKLLKNCQNRIKSMALVHQHLYGNSKLDRVNFASYLEALIDHLAHSQATKERNIQIILDLNPIELNIDTANPCGLIINELVSNALEHAFVNRDRGNIWLSFKQNLQRKIILIIKDDGVGLKEDFDLYNSNSLGLELVCTLVEQLEATISISQDRGTTIEIVFEELNYASRI